MLTGRTLDSVFCVVLATSGELFMTQGHAAYTFACYMVVGFVETLFKIKRVLVVSAENVKHATVIISKR